jgi:TPR repeat protein
MRSHSWSGRVPYGAVATLFLSAAAQAVTFSGSGEAPDTVLESARPGEYFFGQGVLAVRSKDYRHAVAMYQVAASWAYKTAEYNLGVMYARGEGVETDLPRALAWMALAAERNDEKYVQARDLIAAQLDKDGLARAETILATLLPNYGDAAAMPRAKLRWREERDGATGSHLGATGDLAVGSADRRYIAIPSRNGVPNVAAGASKSGQDIVGASAVDGAIAYRQLRETDNPYDPKFEHGVATVGPLTQVDAKKPASKPEATDEDSRKP